MTTLPTDATARKETPIFSGVLMYFPDAIAAVAQLSFVGNEQHNPGEPLHWAREKSTDQLDALTRHLLEAGTIDSDGMRHTAKVAWRALAQLQLEIEADSAKDDEPWHGISAWGQLQPGDEIRFKYDPRRRHVVQEVRVSQYGQVTIITAAQVEVPVVFCVHWEMRRP